MSSRTYGALWAESMSELNELLHIENPELDQLPGTKLPEVKASPLQKFQHFATLYVQYLQVFRNLEKCYHFMKHPQKRKDLKEVLETVMIRVLELRHAIVYWNPPFPDCEVTTCPQYPVPWLYVQLDDLLQDLKLQPEALDVPVPAYFLEDDSRRIEDRDLTVEGYMKTSLGTDKVLVELEGVFEDLTPALSVQDALRILMRNERGRQGLQRALARKKVKEEDEAMKRLAAAGASGADVGEGDLDEEGAAAMIQKVFRGTLARKRAVKARDAELVFLGMKPAPGDRLSALEAAIGETTKMLKEEQGEYQEAYVDAYGSVRERLRAEEGPEVRDKHTKAVMDWYMGQREESMKVESLEPFRAMLAAQAPDEAKAEEALAAATGAGAPKKDKKKDKGKKKGKSKVPLLQQFNEAEVPAVPLTGPTPWTRRMERHLREFEAVWRDRPEEHNLAQKHEDAIIAAELRPEVHQEVRAEVEGALEAMIANVNKLAPEKKKKKKKKKGKKKKGKKGKKGKKLPGEKACAGIDAGQMMSILVQNKIVNSRREDARVSDYVGEFNYLGSAYVNTNTPGQRNAAGTWLPPDPSASQLRALVSELMVLPLGCARARLAVNEYLEAHGMGPHPKSFLLYGPHGSGKTALAQAVAAQTGAMLINLSAGNIATKFTGPGEAAQLLHMAFTLAKDASLGPTVIYVDEVEKILPDTGKKKKKVTEGPARFKKDLAAYINWLAPEDAVVVICATCEPWKLEKKSLHTYFHRGLYLPEPDAGSRLLAWTMALETRLGSVGAAIPPTFDLSTLAHVSAGYTAGSIRKTVQAVLTERRLERLAKRKLTEGEFISMLSRCVRVVSSTAAEDGKLESKEEYLKFHMDFNGLSRAVEVATALNHGEEPSKSKKKKK